MRLKNKITRQESRRPRPKTTGPSVPVENLGKGWIGWYEGRTCYAREDVEVHGEPDEEHFIKLGVFAIFIRHRDGPYGRGVRGMDWDESEFDAPRASTPQRKPFAGEREGSLASCEEAKSFSISDSWRWSDMVKDRRAKEGQGVRERESNIRFG